LSHASNAYANGKLAEAELMAQIAKKKIYKRNELIFINLI
jgi:hypothetical protein